MTENYKLIHDLARKDALGLEEKGKSYGDSWKRRGGVGAFMMLARKWDRIENIVRGHGWDVFAAGIDNDADIIDDIEDLRRYLLLVQAHIESEMRGAKTGQGPNTAPTYDEMVEKMLAKNPSHCKVCGSPGNHAGLPCPRTLQRMMLGDEPQALPSSANNLIGGRACIDCDKNPCECGGAKGQGYVDQDGSPHDPYGRT